MSVVTVTRLMMMYVMKRGARGSVRPLTFEGYNLPKLVRHKRVTIGVVTCNKGR